MCGRFNLRTPMNLLVQQFLFDAADLPVPLPRYNIAPTQDVLAIRTVDGQRHGALLHWGLIPSWATDTKMSYSTINARVETAHEKPAFREALKKRRCLIVADGYYEWKTEGKVKTPYLYEVENGRPFAFAGVWERWNRGGPTAIESCTILTTEANALAQQIHNRMPVILPESDYAAWLDPMRHDSEQLRYLYEPFPAERMTVRPVSRFVNNVRNEGPECLANSA